MTDMAYHNAQIYHSIIIEIWQCIGTYAAIARKWAVCGHSPTLHFNIPAFS